MDGIPCGEGLMCEGAPQETGVGKCVQAESLPGEGESCSGEQACPSDELVCAGTSFGGEGFCVPWWMHGTFEDRDLVDLPEEGTLERSVIAYCLATVSGDVEVITELVHPQPSTLRVVLTNPLGTEGVVFDGPSAAAENPGLDEDGFLDAAGRGPRVRHIRATERLDLATDEPLGLNLEALALLEHPAAAGAGKAGAPGLVRCRFAFQPDFAALARDYA